MSVEQKDLRGMDLEKKNKRKTKDDEEKKKNNLLTSP